MNNEWSTPTVGAVALIGAGVALAAAAAASYQEPPGMVLLGVAAALVIAVGVIALIRRPRLSLLDGPALEVRTLRGTRRIEIDDVESLELLSTRHLVSRSAQLLIETRDGELAVFGRWDLGTSAQSVAQSLSEAGFPLNDRTLAK